MIRKLSHRTSTMQKGKKTSALAGNRTRASRVAGENSTTEPPVLRIHIAFFKGLLGLVAWKARKLFGPEDKCLNPNPLNKKHSC